MLLGDAGFFSLIKQQLEGLIDVLPDIALPLNSSWYL